MTLLPQDADVDALSTRATRISAEIMDLAAEAIRIRDQHRATIDALRTVPVVVPTGDAHTDAVLKFIARERVGRASIVNLAKQMSLPHETVEVAAAAVSKAVQQHAPWSGRPCVGVVPVPIEVLAWAKRECAKLSPFAHPTSAFEPVPGVTIDVLRAWTEALDTASYLAREALEAPESTPTDAGPQSPVVEAVRTAARTAR